MLEAVKLELEAAFRDPNITKALDFLKQDPVKQYLGSLPKEDQLSSILKLKKLAKSEQDRRLICELTDSVPTFIPQFVNTKLESAKKFTFARLQRHANNLLVMGIPAENINIVFQYLCGSKDAISSKSIREAAKGTTTQRVKRLGLA